MKSLGKTLRELREIKRFTLRQVEEATGISNAYLSQLENDKIGKPSANVLYKLSNIYNVELNTLLAAAGIIEKQAAPPHKLLNSIAFSTETPLTKEEEDALLSYLNFIRQQQKQKKNG
jgi:transcriptional regulator with XRE-family HTH domain